MTARLAADLHARGLSANPCIPDVSAKTCCVVPARWTLADHARHTCRDGSHCHFSDREYYEQFRDGAIEVLRFPDRRRRVNAVVRILRIPRRGLSARFGAKIALMLADDASRSVALVMLSDIRVPRRPEAVTAGGDGTGGVWGSNSLESAPRATA